MESTSYLAALPSKILQLIIEHTHASGHWPLAQTCKHVYLNSQPILSRHRKAYQEFRISCDLDPQTVPNLLWSALSPGAASIDAWHVREFEVWTDRINDDLWEVDADTGDLWVVEERKPWSFPDKDIDHFFNKLYKVPDFFPQDDIYHVRAQEELETGADAFLKAFLLAHLPRIQALRYMGKPESEQANFKNLCLMIYWCKLAGTWLPGLEALQKVYVGVNSRRVGDTTIDGQILRPNPPSRELEEFCALLCLPNLSEVYFAHLDGNSDISSEIMDLFPDGVQPLLDKTSPVQTIIIDKLQASLSEQLMDFITKAPSSLKNLAIRFDRFNEYGNRRRNATVDGKQRSQELTQKLAQHQHSSLQRLCFYNELIFGGLSDWNWVAPSQRVMFEDLRVAYFSWPIMEEEVASRAVAARSRSELLDQLLPVFRSQFPATIEIVYLVGFCTSISQSPEFADPPLDYVDDAVEAMIKSERYKNLKAVHLRDNQDEEPDETPGYVPFPKTMKAAEERGVYVHLKGSKPPSWFSFKGEFIPIPTRDCLVTGQFLPEDEDPYLAYCTWVDQGMPMTLARKESPQI
ncbi:unnamed protein product [Clonostachys byssicola]|uniref:Uncharacterized protein n=1 Tax=Clonostachys byssicola TaxID=160290 RepID=A0A9N9UR23_9HYPO|nr:unnamed protein product [Clonostachys byssicola]